MANKIYCGNGKVIKTQYGDITKVSLSQDDINKIVKWMKDNKSKWVNIAIMEKRSPEEGKPTHYLVIDEWKPKEDSTPKDIKPSKVDEDNEDDDLPF